MEHVLHRRGATKPGRPYPERLRSLVVAAVEAGASYRQAAARHGVSVSAAHKWVQRFHQTGSFAAKPMGGDRRLGFVATDTGNRAHGRSAANPCGIAGGSLADDG
jgi:transposase-like protein